MGTAEQRASMVRTTRRHRVSQAGTAGQKKSRNIWHLDVEYRVVEDGVALPTYFNATFDTATGKLLSYSQADVAASVGRTPSISREEAVRIASEYSRMPVYALDKAGLVIMPQENGQARLIWDVVIHAGGGENSGTESQVILDARTGEVVFVPW